MNKTFNSIYFQFSKLMEKHGIDLMRYALAIVYIWFGMLKLTGMSPAEDLVQKTVFWFKPELFIPILGLVEVLIGIGFLFKKLIPLTIIVLLLHMVATFFPLFILPKICFNTFYCPTLVGQYIIKNLVLICGSFCIAGKYNMQYYALSTVKK
ncbi:hypothetical protein [Flavobacterium sp. N3904]|uniref:hypothetical protein n=1 Tax=Flavobacterium sp. N3904 TaxID=2986835 RepID=UPI00222577CE|nr:hypothetical protein [Flavobacterium sp. N3904]